MRDVRRAGVNFRCPTCVGGGWREVDVRQVRMGEAPLEVLPRPAYTAEPQSAYLRIAELDAGREYPFELWLQVMWKRGGREFSVVRRM